MHDFNIAMKKVRKLLYKMAAFVLEITEPDCHLLENKYFLNYTVFKKKTTQNYSKFLSKADFASNHT